MVGRALAELERAVELAPGSVDARLAHGRALTRYRRHAAAKTALTAARKLDPDDPRVLEALAELAEDTHDAQTAEAWWREIESRLPSARSARRLAELARESRPQESLDWFEACLDRDPADQECAVAAGELALRASLFDRARTCPRIEVRVGAWWHWRAAMPASWPGPSRPRAVAPISPRTIWTWPISWRFCSTRRGRHRRPERSGCGFWRKTRSTRKLAKTSKPGRGSGFTIPRSSRTF